MYALLAVNIVTLVVLTPSLTVTVCVALTAAGAYAFKVTNTIIFMAPISTLLTKDKTRIREVSLNNHIVRVISPVKSISIEEGIEEIRKILSKKRKK